MRRLAVRDAARRVISTTCTPHASLACWSPSCAIGHRPRVCCSRRSCRCSEPPATTTRCAVRRLRGSPRWRARGPSTPSGDGGLRYCSPVSRDSISVFSFFAGAGDALCQSPVHRGPRCAVRCDSEIFSARTRSGGPHDAPFAPVAAPTDHESCSVLRIVTVEHFDRLLQPFFACLARDRPLDEVRDLPSHGVPEVALAIEE